jgi:hypothetical protein
MKFRELTPAEVGRFTLVGSLGSYAMAVLSFYHPTVPDGRGPWAWLHVFIYQNFGPRGQCGLWVVIGTLLFVSYFNYRNKRPDR